MRVGLQPDEFWSMTPREFFLYRQAWSWRQGLLHDNAIRTGWYAASFDRMKRLKSLQHYLTPKKKPKAKPEDADKLRAEFEDAVERMAPDRKVA